MRQHYIPKFILEGFADAEEGNRGVWVYFAKQRQWAKRPTRRTASTDDFYSLIEPSGERNDTIETYLHQTETMMAVLLQRDIARRRLIASKPRRHDAVIAFCSELFARNPATMSRAKETLVREAMKTVDEVIQSRETFDRFREEYKAATGKDFPNFANFQSLKSGFNLSATKAGGLSVAIGTAEVIAEKLEGMSVDFLMAPAGGPTFITSDIPYVLIYSDATPTAFDQVIIPLSAVIAVIFNADCSPRYDYVEATARDVRSVNRAILSVAQELLIARDPTPFDRMTLERWAAGDLDSRLQLVTQLVNADSPGA